MLQWASFHCWLTVGSQWSQITFTWKDLFVCFFCFCLLQMPIYEQLVSVLVWVLTDGAVPIEVRGDSREKAASCLCSYRANTHPLRLWNATCPLLNIQLAMTSPFAQSPLPTCLLCVPPHFLPPGLSLPHTLSQCCRSYTTLAWQTAGPSLSLPEVCVSLSVPWNLNLRSNSECVSLLSPWKRSAILIPSQASENNQSTFHEVTRCTLLSFCVCCVSVGSGEVSWG